MFLLVFGRHVGESVFLERSEEQRRNEAEEADEEDGILEYDSSSSEDLDDESFSTNNDEADDDVGGIPSLDCEATFLLGTVSRFGRTVRFNSRPRLFKGWITLSTG